MKGVLACITVAILISISNLGFSQDDQLKLQVKEGLMNALDTYDTCQYRTKMLFKSMGEDTFDVRNFKLSFRKNPANQLYGYDWEFSEYVEGGSLNYIFLADSLYYYFDQNKQIFRKKLPDQIHTGDFTEAMRVYFSLDETIKPFILISPDEFTVLDSNNYYYLDRQTRDWATRRLIVDKTTFLPFRGINIISDLGLEQVQDIYYIFEDDPFTLADASLNPNYFKSLGYEIIEWGEPEKTVEPKPDPGFSEEEVSTLLNYAFITEGDVITTIGETEGKYLLLDFWYASCFPCLRALPEINAVDEKYAPKGLTVLGINCIDKSNRINLYSKFRKNKITIPLFFGEGDLLQKLKIASFPTYVLVMPDRRIEVIKGNVNDVKYLLKGIFEK